MMTGKKHAFYEVTVSPVSVSCKIIPGVLLFNKNKLYLTANPASPKYHLKI